MAAVVDSLVPTVLEYAGRLLEGEYVLLTGVKDKVETLKTTLKLVDGFLRDSEGKRHDNEIKAVMTQVREDVEAAQDVIDDYVVHQAEMSRKSFFQKAFNSVDYAAKLHEVNDKIETLSKRIEEIYGNKGKYGITKGGSTPTSTEAKSQVHTTVSDPSLQKRRMEVAEDDDVVGFDKYADDVIRLLTQGSSRRDIVSIVGMGGLGKTTLARKVYKDDVVKDNFDRLAWAFVSQDIVTPRAVLISLLRCLKPDSGDDDDEVVNNYGSETNVENEAVVIDLLKNEVKRRLNRVKYLVVLDDIWDVQVWREIQDAFPDKEGFGSRILITSREVGLHSTPNGVYHLPFLEPEDSWKLFCKRVFRQEQCPDSTLEGPGREMVEKCEGLPLSIVVLAGLLEHMEWSETEWTSFNKDVISKIAEDKVGRVKDILKLSYDNLPQRLKPCFLHLGIFPVEYDIVVRRLIHLWVAEGLVDIDPSKDKSPEEFAEGNLKELIARNLVQVLSKRSDGGPKTCRVHDHLRDLCLSESKQDIFYEIRTRHALSVTGKPRRLSLHCSTNSYKDATTDDLSHTRSLYCLGQKQSNSYFYDDSWEWLLKHFKLIRVLDIGQVARFSFHKNTDHLIHLRYLRVDSESFFSAQSCIWELWNLETLDMRNCMSISIPDRICDLKQLRHLYTSYAVGFEAILPKLSERQVLWNLQTLSVITLDKRSRLLLEKGRFPNLKKLGLTLSSGLSSDDVKFLLAKLQSLTHLKTLKIINPKELVKTNEFPPSLTKITLVYSPALTQETTNALGNIPTLRILKVSGVKHLWRFDLHVPPKAFKKLQVFQMKSMGCENWKLEEDAMPNLCRLVIKKCDRLTEIPQQLRSSTALREVEVCKDMSEILEQNLNDIVNNGCQLTIKD